MATQQQTTERQIHEFLRVQLGMRFAAIVSMLEQVARSSNLPQDQQSGLRTIAHYLRHTSDRATSLADDLDHGTGPGVHSALTKLARKTVHPQDPDTC